MRQSAGVEAMLGKRGIRILCSGVTGSCEPSDVDRGSHTQVYWKTTSSPNYRFFPKPYFPFGLSFSVFLFCYWGISITHIVLLGQIPIHSFNTSRSFKTSYEKGVLGFPSLRNIKHCMCILKSCVLCVYVSMSSCMPCYTCGSHRNFDIGYYLSYPLRYSVFFVLHCCVSLGN